MALFVEPWKQLELREGIEEERVRETQVSRAEEKTEHMRSVTVPYI